jgi:phospholipid transport system substrate-binding protein
MMSDTNHPEDNLMKKIGLKQCLLATCMFSLVTAASAETMQKPTSMPARVSAPSTMAAQQDNPVTMLQEGIEKLLAQLVRGYDPVTIGAFLEKEIAPSFDFEHMARSASGSLYRRMDQQQKVRLQKKLKVMFLGSMAEKLARFSGQEVVFLPPRFRSFKQTSISALINNPGQYPSRIDFRVHLTNDGWKVIDVAAGGQSAVAYYRSYFREVMGNNSRRS